MEKGRTRIINSRHAAAKRRIPIRRRDTEMSGDAMRGRPVRQLALNPDLLALVE
jgi:hypothetical protein